MDDAESARLLSIQLLLHQLWSRFLYYEATTEDDPEGFLEAWQQDMLERLERDAIMITAARGAAPGSPAARYADKVREAYEASTDNIVRMAADQLEADQDTGSRTPPRG